MLAHNAFVRATLTNFFFSLSLNGYVLLPLHVHALGGTDVAIGLVMGVYSAVGIVCQPLVGPWVDALGRRDRKSTRLNSSHVSISYAVFCLKKKMPQEQRYRLTP